jgi:hypothetical protein
MVRYRDTRPYVEAARLDDRVYVEVIHQPELSRTAGPIFWAENRMGGVDFFVSSTGMPIRRGQWLVRHPDGRETAMDHLDFLARYELSSRHGERDE